MINWDDQPLGMESDISLAIKLGVDRSTVSKARRKKKIPAFFEKSKHKRSAGQKAGIDWDSQPLGKASDKDLGEALGVTAGAVRMARRRKNIPRYKTAHKKGSSGYNVGIDWDSQPLGDMHDAQLARTLNVSESAVRKARAHRNIQAYRMRKRMSTQVCNCAIEAARVAARRTYNHTFANEKALLVAYCIECCTPRMKRVVVCPTCSTLGTSCINCGYVTWSQKHIKEHHANSAWAAVPCPFCARELNKRFDETEGPY